MPSFGILRGACLGHRLLQPPLQLTSIGPLRRRSAVHPATLRIFTTSSPWKKEGGNAGTAPAAGTLSRATQSEVKTESIESPKPESVQKPKPAEPIKSTKQPSLLAEQNVTNKEQRKADWAIIKDMARYLWPKNDFGTRFRVSLSVALLVGAKVATSQSCPRQSQ